MSAWFESANFPGMANWMRIQAQEELTHAMKFFDFIHERNGTVTLVQVEAPKTAWDSPRDAFQAAYEHECKISGLINGLVDLALQESDHAANAFLQWFVSEQVEEEASVLTIVDKLKLVGDNSVALFMVDGELGQRVPAAPADSAGG
jgi:ferritin